jgi:hypothetical protein
MLGVLGVLGPIFVFFCSAAKDCSDSPPFVPPLPAFGSSSVTASGIFDSSLFPEGREKSFALSPAYGSSSVTASGIFYFILSHKGRGKTFLHCTAFGGIGTGPTNFSYRHHLRRAGRSASGWGRNGISL